MRSRFRETHREGGVRTRQCPLLLLSLVVSMGLSMSSRSYADATADIVAKCDSLAATPFDPGAYAAPVPDDRFAPGAAMEACKAAVDASPNLPRLWFQLGRAYWLANRDADAFAAFVKAAKQNYAPALKWLGDAYNEGRGLPVGEQQSLDTALSLYQRAYDGGYRTAAKAIDEAKSILTASRFDPGGFQNSSYMSLMYSGDFSRIDNPITFLAYVQAFSHELGGNNVYMTNQSCKGMVTSLSGMITGVQTLGAYINALQEDDGVLKALLSSILSSAIYSDQGERDANILVDRYKCDGPITKRIVANVIGSYDKLPGLIRASLVSPERQAAEERAALQRRAASLQASARDACNKAFDRPGFCGCTMNGLVSAGVPTDQLETLSRNFRSISILGSKNPAILNVVRACTKAG
jgi:hypothetical protein